MTSTRGLETELKKTVPKQLRRESLCSLETAMSRQHDELSTVLAEQI